MRKVNFTIKNTVKMVKVMLQEVDLKEVDFHTVEDVQAVVCKATGLVAGLQWKRHLDRIHSGFDKGEKVLSVCPFKSVDTGEMVVVIATDKKVILSDRRTVVKMDVADVTISKIQKGVVSHHLLFGNQETQFKLEWASMELLKHLMFVVVDLVNGGKEGTQFQPRIIKTGV